MQQTNGVTAVISQEQSDLVTSATISAGGQKDAIKNGKSVIIANNPASINKTKITTLITSANNSKSSSNTTTNINNNNSTTTNKNNSPNNKAVPNGRADVIVTNLQHKLNSSKKNVTISEPATNQTSSDASSGNGKTTAPTAPLPDARAKQVLKEAVDAVVNSFTKHTQGYGRGEFINLNINLFIFIAGAPDNINLIKISSLSLPLSIAGDLHKYIKKTFKERHFCSALGEREQSGE